MSKYTYSFRRVPYSNGGASLVMDFDDPKLDLLSEYLLEVTYINDYNWVVKSIDKVLNGESEYEDVDVEFTELLVRKETSIMISAFAEYVDGVPLEIETVELRKLIDIWYNEYTKFESEKQKENVKNSFLGLL